MEFLLQQDGGIVRTIFANSQAIAKIALSDNSISEESKMIIEQLALQNDILHNKYLSMLPENKKISVEPVPVAHLRSNGDNN